MKLSFSQKIKENWGSTYSRLVIISDVLLFNFSFFASFVVSREDYFTLFELSSSPYLLLLISNAFFLLSHILLGDYRDVGRLKVSQQIALTVKSCMFFGCGFLLLMIAFHKITYVSRVFPALFLLLLYFFSIRMRSLLCALNQTLHNKGFGKKNTLILGIDQKALRLAHVLTNEWSEFGYDIKGFVAFSREKKPFNYQGNTIVGTIDELKDCIHKTRCQYLLLTGESFTDQEWFSDIIQLCLRENIPLRFVPAIFEKFIDNSQIRDIIGCPIVHFRDPNVQKRWKYVSRIIYWIFSLLSLSLLFPVFVLIGIMIKLDSKGPVLFKQKRMLWEEEKKITIYKFRTMIDKAPLLTHDISRIKKTHGVISKSKDDDRITRIGRFLRKYSIDELPQLINILQGKMGLVGPRPFSDIVFGNLEDTPYYRYLRQKRAAVLPGITGLWQVNGRTDITFDEMLFLDLYYIEHQSVFLDLEILFKTISVVVTCQGAY